jgi:hypothetical protein
MVPIDEPAGYVDVTDALDDPPIGQSILLDMANMNWDEFIATQEGTA